MPFLLTKIHLQDIKADAKVLSTGYYLQASRNREWEPDLWAEQRQIQQLKPGESMMTSGREFDAKCGIITVPPVWAGGEGKEALYLAACYDSALRLVRRRRCRSVAFPLLAGDCHGFPKELALETAIHVIREFLEKRELTVYLSVPDIRIPREKYNPLGDYLEEVRRSEAEKAMPLLFAEEEKPGAHSLLCHPKGEKSTGAFALVLQETMKQRKLTDSQLCRRANLDRKFFLKLRNNYPPTKGQVLALALGLELDLEETRAMLETAGYKLDPGSRFDNILTFYIEAGNYDHYEINQALFSFGEPLIGE